MADLPSSFMPRRWTNAPLTLYHGTIETLVPAVLRGVEVGHGRARTDFGQGFYTTTVERQAVSWATEQARRHREARAAVIRFDIDRDGLAALEGLWFVRGGFDAEDFWSLVFHCRGGGLGHGRTGPQPWYDVVVGSITASWSQRLTFADVDQLSFHTDRSARLLNESNPRSI